MPDLSWRLGKHWQTVRGDSVVGPDGHHSDHVGPQRVAEPENKQVSESWTLIGGREIKSKVFVMSVSRNIQRGHYYSFLKAKGSSNGIRVCGHGQVFCSKGG